MERIPNGNDNNGANLAGAWENIAEGVRFAPANATGVMASKAQANEVITESSTEALLSERDKRTIRMVTEHPAFAFGEADGTPFYTEERLKELYSAIGALMQRVETEHTDLPIPERIETILADNVDDYKFSKDYKDPTTRTAYSLLCGEKKGSNCVGFSETCCMLLDLNGYEATPVISRLNKKGLSGHYVTVYEDESGNVRIVDPERRRSCSEPEKQYNLTAYQMSLRYAVPDEDFCTNKIGESGIGPVFDDAFAPEAVRGPIDQITVVPGSDDDKALQIFEAVSGDHNARIELREQSMNSDKKRLFDAAISETLRPIYKESVSMMGGSNPSDAESVVA